MQYDVLMMISYIITNISRLGISVATKGKPRYCVFYCLYVCTYAHNKLLILIVAAYASVRAPELVIDIISRLSQGRITVRAQRIATDYATDHFTSSRESDDQRKNAWSAKPESSLLPTGRIGT